MDAFFGQAPALARRDRELLNARPRANREDHAWLGAGADVTVGHAAIEIDRIAGVERRYVPNSEDDRRVTKLGVGRHLDSRH